MQKPKWGSEKFRKRDVTSTWGLPGAVPPCSLPNWIARPRQRRIIRLPIASIFGMVRTRAPCADLTLADIANGYGPTGYDVFDCD